MLREYLEEETFVRQLGTGFDLERVVDDFVLLCVLVGNDFLPHSPTLDINEGAMDQIFDAYRDMLRSTGRYLTFGEAISHVSLEYLLGNVAQHETETLKQRAQVRTLTLKHVARIKMCAWDALMVSLQICC